MAEKKIELCRMKAEDIKTVFGNHRKIGKKRLEELEKSFEMFGDFGIYLIDEHDNIIAGNQRLRVVLMNYGPDTILDCKRLIGYTQEELRATNIKDNIHAGEWDLDLLAEWTADLNVDFGISSKDVPIDERKIKDIELIRYEKYDYVLLVCRSKVSISSPEAIKVTNDKVTLSKPFPDYMPKQIIAHNALDCVAFTTSVGYPNKLICCKLPNKCGGIGFSVVDEVRGRNMTLFNKFGMSRFITLGMLTELVDSTNETVILQEYEEGTDCSICGLADNGVLLHALGFEGLAMAYGSAMIARICMNESAIAITRKVVEATGIDGNFCCDFILKDDGSAVLLEVNPRLSGTLPFIAEAGMNLPYMICA